MKARRHAARKFRAFASSILAIFLAAWALPARAAEAPVARAIERARQMRLWTDVAWLRLLHYRAGTLGGIGSDIDSAAFFLARNGSSDPRAELEATLRAMYQAPWPRAKRARVEQSETRRGSGGVTPREDYGGAGWVGENRHARCRFPARTDWLAERLGLAHELPPLRCSRLERFEARVTPESVALVYAANSVDRPVSAFGHTFLVLRRAGERLGSENIVEFTAETDTDNPVLYALKGIAGAFPGRFRLGKFSEKLDLYLEKQERDLWEYELALTKSELRRFARHLWELMPTRLDYYYATKNCSYGLLSLLEAAAPRLELIENTKFVVLPADTVKALFVEPGLVRSVHHRPAREKSPPGLKSPHLGHGSMRLLLGVGYTSQYEDTSANLGYRIALHDFADPAEGQPELSQVQFMDVRVRYLMRQRSLQLNELTFAELTTLHSLLRGPSPSWRVRAHGYRLHDAGCDNEDCFAHGLNGSLGFTLATWDERVAAFAMADAYLLFSFFSGQLDGIGGSFVRAGVGPFVGMRVHAPDPLVTVLSGTWSYLPGQNLTSTYELRGALRALLAPDAALGIEVLLQPSAIEGQFLSYLYF